MSHIDEPQTNNASAPRSLIAGGAGFLGSHLCDRLLADGQYVICADNLVTGRIENIKHLMELPRFAFAAWDVTAPADLDDLLTRARRCWPGPKRLDYILHLASPASPKDYARHPIQTLQSGAAGTYHLLELARTYGSTFLLASTSEVYGDPELSPQKESYWGRVNPVGPRSVYDEAKRFAEAMTMAYHHEYQVPVRIARIFNTYGERMRASDGRVVSNFVTQALAGTPLTIFGNGSQTRSLCYVSDLVEGLCDLLFSHETGPINLGNPDEVTILDLAKEVLDLASSSSTLDFQPLPADDPRQRCPDISLAASRLSWRPKVSRRDGLCRLISYFGKQRQTRASGIMSSRHEHSAAYEPSRIEPTFRRAR